MKIFGRNPHEPASTLDLSMKDLMKGTYDFVIEPVGVEIAILKDLSGFVIVAIMNKEQTQKFRLKLSNNVGQALAKVLNEQLGNVESKIQ